MDLGLHNKIALVAASSRGLGRACAHTFSAEGAKVAICARDAKALRATADEIARDTGNEVLAIVADLTGARDVERVVSETVKHFGALHILVTNNGGPPPGHFFDFDDRDWQQAFNLTLMSAVRLIRAAVPYMQAQKWGRIVNLVSYTVKEPIDNLILSNSIRAGVIGLAKTLANELAADNITVNNVCPAYTLTERVRELAEDTARRTNRSVDEVIQGYADPVPMGRLGTPEEFADLVVFLASERAGYITGQSIAFDGGRTRFLLG